MEVTGNNGASWQFLEIIGPHAREQQHAGWFTKTLQIPADAATDKFKIRFTAYDTASGSISEAALDAVRVDLVVCTPTCPSDFNRDGFVTGDDFDAYVLAFTAGEDAGDFNGDGFVTGDDFDGFADAFASGC